MEGIDIPLQLLPLEDRNIDIHHRRVGADHFLDEMLKKLPTFHTHSCLREQILAKHTQIIYNDFANHFERWNVMRLTQAVVQQILAEKEGFTKSVLQYGGKITWHYIIKNGKLLIYESGKMNWSDSRFDTRIDGEAIVATIEQTRNFIRKYIL